MRDTSSSPTIDPTGGPSIDPPLLLTRADLMHHLRVSASVLDRWLSEKYFPGPDFTRGAKLRFWRRETLTKWIAEKSGGGAGPG